MSVAAASRRGFVALRRFTASYGGEPVEISAGEWCADGHELVRRFPHCFRPAGQAPAPASTGSRDYLVAPAPRTPPGALPIAEWAIPIPRGELLPPGPQILRASARSTDTIRVTAAAREDILHAIEHTPAGFETGGLLLGPRRDASGFTICEAGGAGANAIRERDRLVLDVGAMLSRALEIARRPEVDFTRSPLGYWHVHPTSALEPSDADLSMFAAVSAALGLRCAHLIVAPDGEMTAWVVRQDDPPLQRRLVCERAEIQS